MHAANEQKHGLLGDIAGASFGSVLAAVAAVRRAKAVHPDGVAYDARFVAAGTPAAPRAAELLRERREYRAIVRFSRSVGVPHPIPDLLGMGIRVIDAYGRGRHQDFLLVSSADHHVMHHLFLPARDVQQRPYSSAVPYRAGDERFIVGALPDPRSPRMQGRTEFDRLDAAAVTGRLRFQFAVAAVRGRFRPVAELHIAGRLDELDALRFNPWNTGGGLEPAGWLNGARDRAYKLSQAAWRRTHRNGTHLQERADRQVEALARGSDERG
jgi:hypothetical protein